MKKQYVFCLLVAFATNSFAAENGWSRVNSKTPSGSQKKSSTAKSNRSNALVNELLEQVQMMQQELSELRGLVEQQDNELRKLKKSQTASYQDVDKRLRELSDAQKKQKTAKKSTLSVKKQATPSASDYKTAMKLVRAKKYDKAITEFSSFYKANPKSKLAANSLYWIGEIQMVKGNKKMAKDNFLKVIKLFPKHTKSADARYKLAVIKHKEGDLAAAKKELRELIKNQANISPRIARLAKAYLKRLETP